MDNFLSIIVNFSYFLHFLLSSPKSQTYFRFYLLLLFDFYITYVISA